MSSKSKHPLRKFYDVISISQDVGRDSWILFRFRMCWRHCFQKVKVYQQTKFRRDISIGGWDISTSCFEIQTSAILEFYFPFRSRPLRRNLHVILNQATEFRPNRSTHCRNMTSYPFLKMVAATAKYYFRFRICSCHYQDISIGGGDISTSGFEIQTSAILEFYFRFRYRPVRRNLHVILYQATKFRPNRSTYFGNMTLYPFLKMAAATVKYYFRFRICWCHCLQKVKVYQLTKFRRYLNWRLRYNYFRFRNTNIRHIGILLQVSISTISP